jgi:hypothetical protein
MVFGLGGLLKGLGINGRMAVGSVAGRAGHDWIIMRLPLLIPALQGTIETASKNAVMSDQTVETCHTWSICCFHHQERARCNDLVVVCIPNSHAFLLQSS